MVVPSTVKELKTLLQNFDAKDSVALEQIAGLAARYPYFQLATALHAKALHAQEKLSAEGTLNKAAVVTANRALLRQLFNDSPEILQKTTGKQKGASKKAKPKTATKKLAPKPQATEAKEAPKAKAAPAPQEQYMSFSDWIHKIQENPAPSEPKASKWELIDKFIEANPSIGPVDKNATTAAGPELKNEYNTGTLMTETLAKLFVQQQKYDEALKAYGILRLKYPEKNSFFADQIKAIKRLKKQKD